MEEMMKYLLLSSTFFINDDLNCKHVKPRSHFNLIFVFMYCLPNLSIHCIIEKLMKNHRLQLLQEIKIKIFDIIIL